MADRDRRRFEGQPSLSEHCGHGGTCQLARPNRDSPEGLALAQAQRNYLISRPAALIQIVALQTRTIFSHSPLASTLSPPSSPQTRAETRDRNPSRLILPILKRS